jgi:hypothetical protein
MGQFTLWKQWVREVQIVRRVMTAKDASKNPAPFKPREPRPIEEVREPPVTVFPVDISI